MNRSDIAETLWALRAARHQARVRANDDIDAGYPNGYRFWAEKIKEHNARIAALRQEARRTR